MGLKGFRFLRILVDGEDPEKILMEIEGEKRKKKPKKIVRRKSYRKEKPVNVEDVASKVNGMKINKGNAGLGIPDIYVEQESKSQPGSRRNSTLPSTLLLNPSEVTRRASLVPTEVTGRSSNAFMIPDEASYGRRESQDTQILTRRGSVKRGSLSWEEEEALEAKKLKATLEAMGMMKKKQKEFTWDAVQQEKKEAEDQSISRRRSSDVNVQMSKETAMKVLGLTNKAGGKILRPRLVTDYTEFEILIAFQKECNKASMIV